MVDRLGASAGEKTTLVEDGTEFKGSFTSKCRSSCAAASRETSPRRRSR